VSDNQPTNFLRIKEAAKVIDMSPSFLRKEAKLGRGPERARLGKVILYPMDGLRAYLSSRMERCV